MTLTIELSPDEVKRVEEARAGGVDVERHLHDALLRLPPSTAPCARDQRPDRTAALLRRWLEEDETDDPQELERRERENNEFFDNLRRNRVNFPVPKVQE